MLHDATNWLFNPSGLTPHGFCLLWSPGLIWLHALSDIAVGLAYFSIPITLAGIIRHRPDLILRPLFGLFAAFILLCGIGHLLGVLTLWVPAYGIEGVMKAATAIISIISAVALRQMMPQILAFPSPAQLRRAHRDVVELRQAETRLMTIAQEAAEARDALTHELTRREAAEKRMQESEERFQLLLQSNVAEALYLLDPDGNIETWNVAAERIKGYRAEEIIGRNFALFFTPDDIAAGVPASLLARARDSGRFSSECWRVRKNGARFLARISIDAIRRPNGTLRGFVKVTQDITDRKIEEEQRAIIVEAAPNGMLIVDEHGTITMANREASRIFEYPDGHLIGQKVDLLIPPEQSEAHELLRAALDQGQVGQVTAPPHAFVARKRDGSTIPTELMVNTVRTPRGHIVVASLFDISGRLREAAAREEAERRERRAADAANAELDRLSHHLADARDRAEAANRAKSRFLASITHELRTPLHGLLGYAEMLTLEGGLNPRQMERLETMMAAGQHLLGMVNAVLDMSQIEADRLELHPADVELSELIAVCLNVVRPSAEARGLRLGKPPGTTARVVADPTRLRQVLINLLGNAVKFTPAGAIDLRVRDATRLQGVRVEVADTGPGVQPADRDRLFNTFERLNANAVSLIEGTGLGLAISARLVQLMGGHIGYEDNPGGGSIFWLELPASPAAAQTVHRDQASDGAQASPRMRVLVADDEVLNRNIAGGFLTRAGHDVVCVDDGAAAVARAANDDFDVILMDVRMPGVNGMEATRRIRDLPGARGRVRIVGVTAQAFEEQIALCRQAGMDDHLSKPFNQPMLLASLHGKHAGAPDAAPAVPIFDGKMFRETVEFVPAPEIINHVRTLISRCEAMLLSLREPGALSQPKTLIEQVHKLAGATSMFGLVAAGEAARAFERAATTGAPEIEAIAERLSAALEASVGALQGELDARVRK